MELDQPQQPRPRTLIVAVLLAMTALIFSYLAAYAASSALLAAEMISPWPTGQDPRPRWMLIGFLSLLVVFLALTLPLRYLTRRQLNRIDAIADE